MECEICTQPVEVPTWVRPRQGGRREKHFFCQGECKTLGLRSLEVRDLVETHGILGWDVFIPAGQR